MTPEHKAAIAEGKRRAKEARAMMEENGLASQSPPDMTDAVRFDPRGCEVIYRPFDGEPHTTKWNGIVFKANVPVLLDRNNPAHSYEQLLPKTIPGPNGEIHTKHVPTKVFMGEIAKGNPAFEVDGVRTPRMVNKRILPPAGHGWAEDHEDEISESTQLEDVA